MADVKITELPELITAAGEDLLAIIDDPSGTPITKKITRTNFLSGLISDEAFGASWSGITDVAPSKNAIYNYIKEKAWTDGGTYIYATDEGGNLRIHDSGQLEIGATGGTSAPLISTDKWGFSSNVTEDGRRLLILDGTEDETLTPAIWLEKLYDSNSAPSGDPTVPVCLYAAHKHSGSGTGFTHTIMSYALNYGTGDNDVVAISGRTRKKGAGAGDSCGIWGSAYNDVDQDGGVMGVEASIYQNAAGMVAGDRLDSKWSCALHVMGSSTGSHAKAGIAIDATNSYRFWNAIIIDKECFGGTGDTGSVGINMGSCDSSRYPQYGIKFGRAHAHIYGAVESLCLQSDQSMFFHKKDDAAENFVWRKGPYSGYTDLMVLDNSGNLEVIGTVTASCGTLTCDYVFEPDYNLMPLDNLDKYIKAEKSLPGMTINKGGSYNSATLRQETVEKIEEQTLYILQIHKRLQDVEKQLRGIKNGRL